MALNLLSSLDRLPTAHTFQPPSMLELLRLGMSQVEAEAFQRLMVRYGELRGGREAYLPWAAVGAPPDSFFLQYSALPEVAPRQAVPPLLDRLAVIKLNGGLGSSMGLHLPKSLVEIRPDWTFLDSAVRQIEYLNTTYHVDLPLVLMNSFHTDSVIKKLIKKYAGRRVRIETFCQSRFPRIYKDTLSLLAKADPAAADDAHWYPPGSGDVFQSLKTSGLLAQLLAAGKEYLFISNIENLGGTVDVRILQAMHQQQLDFVLEVTDRTSVDTQGGILVAEQGSGSGATAAAATTAAAAPGGKGPLTASGSAPGPVKLLETSQIPPEWEHKFNDRAFNHWNTNSMWVSLKALDALLSRGPMELGFIENVRAIKDVLCVQVETPAGTAVQNFSRAAAVQVPRDRFRAVKGIDALFILQSNLFSLEQSTGNLVMNPRRTFPSMPVVKLGEGFKDVREYARRFKNIPDCLELDHLTVSGDVTFGEDVVLKGTVIIIAGNGEHIDIPAGAVLENKIISGSLHIHDH